MIAIELPDHRLIHQVRMTIRPSMMLAGAKAYEEWEAIPDYELDEECGERTAELFSMIYSWMRAQEIAEDQQIASLDKGGDGQ